jgi:hypothetical protein
MIRLMSIPDMKRYSPDPVFEFSVHAGRRTIATPHNLNV